ncbi:MAG: DUF4105 domain-containing protein [Candidatus Paceibacterota bacterium]
MYQILPEVSFSGDIVTIHNIRNFSYITEDDFEKNYYTATFDLNKIKSVDYILVPFSDNKLKAHTMLSFVFEDGTSFTLSPEGRREKGEQYSLFNATIRRLELAYLITSENDALTLRAVARNNSVYLYPLVLTSESRKTLALDMLGRSKELFSSPTWYSLFSDACALNVVRHIQKSVQSDVPLFNFKIFVSSFSDSYLYDNNLIATSTRFEKMKQDALISEKIRRYADMDDFSRKIREVESEGAN